MGRPRTSFIASVVRITSWISLSERTSTSSRCFWRQPTSGVASVRGAFIVTSRSSRVGGRRDPLDTDGVLAVDLDHGHLDHLVAGSRDVLPHVIGADRELTMAAVNEDREADRPRAPEVDEGIHGG